VGGESAWQHPAVSFICEGRTPAGFTQRYSIRTASAVRQSPFSTAMCISLEIDDAGRTRVASRRRKSFRSRSKNEPQLILAPPLSPSPSFKVVMTCAFLHIRGRCHQTPQIVTPLRLDSLRCISTSPKTLSTPPRADQRISIGRSVVPLLEGSAGRSFSDVHYFPRVGIKRGRSRQLLDASHLASLASCSAVGLSTAHPLEGNHHGFFVRCRVMVH
jgi:hypothetical protein